MMRHRLANLGMCIRLINSYPAQEGLRSTMTVVHFDPSGKHIFAGTSTGSVLVFNARTKTVSVRQILHLVSLLINHPDGCKTQNCGCRYHKRPRVCKERPVRISLYTAELRN